MQKSEPQGGGRKLNKIAHYSLTGHLLGKGNFARVEEATHSILDFKVAIKIIDTSKIKDVKYVTKNLYREAEILCSLSHPSIMYLYETFQHGPLYFLVTEVAEGGDLCAHIKRQRTGRLDERVTRKFARQIVAALSHMHERGVVHRDLKMENIMLDATQQHVKIVDFGLSHSWFPGAILETHCGSPEYAAPELFDGAARYGAEVDLWSIGVVLFGMATGRLPFRLPSSRLMSSVQRREQLLVQVQRGFHTLQERALMHMPHEFRNVVRLLLTVNVSERLTVEELRCHPWITSRQSKMIADSAYKPLVYQEQDKVIAQISSLLCEAPALVAAAIRDNCLGKEGGMYNILFHKRSMSACLEDRSIAEEIQKVKSRLSGAGGQNVSPWLRRSPSPAPLSRTLPSRALTSRQPLSFRSKTDEQQSRAQQAASVARPLVATPGRRPSTTLSPYETAYVAGAKPPPGHDAARPPRSRPATMGTLLRNVGSSCHRVESPTCGGVEHASVRRNKNSLAPSWTETPPERRKAAGTAPNSAPCMSDKSFPQSQSIVGWKCDPRVGGKDVGYTHKFNLKPPVKKMPFLDLSKICGK